MQVEDTYFKVPALVFESESEIFNTMFTLPPSSGEVEGQSDDLELSVKWAMDNIRSMAIKKIYEAYKDDAHTLGRKYDVDEWIFIAVEMLVRRANPMDPE